MNKEIITLEKEVAPVVAQASQLVITGTEQLQNASILRKQIKEVINKVAESKEQLYRPAKDTLDAINARYKPYEKPLEEALKLINSKMSLYQTRILRDKQEAEAKIASRIGEGKGHLKIETALNKIDALEAPAELAGTGFIKKQVLVITDASLISREYLIIDERKVETALKAGISVPGATLENILIPRTR